MTADKAAPPSAQQQDLILATAQIAVHILQIKTATGIPSENDIQRAVEMARLIVKEAAKQEGADPNA